MLYSLDNGTPRCAENVFVAQSATVVGDVVLGNNVGIWFGAVVRGDNERITVGNGTNIQDCCVLHTDPGCPLDIGDNVTVGHKAVLHGCTVGNWSLIGINAVVLNNARIGENCLVGANALITDGKQIPDNSLVVGSPGRVIRKLNDSEIDMLKRFNQSYIDKIRRYKSSLKEVADE
ncbi:MAG: gamma carbonic anhydrase family protein [Acidiferrobacterales bacterium]|nr:gamma carbonic anhydrase family protein [Acidiferrobacterales bacterium]